MYEFLLISEVYIEMNQEGAIYRKPLGYSAVTICMFASSYSNFYYASRWANTFIYNNIWFLAILIFAFSSFC